MTLKNIFFGAAILLSYVQLYGQNCVRLIRTKYDSAQNNELNSFFPNKINPWLNTFDFAAIDNGTAFADIPLNPNAGWLITGYTGGNLSMMSPYSVSMPSEYRYLSKSPNGGVDGVDKNWEDGWELMWMNTGFYPNGDSINVADTNRVIKTNYGLANPRTPYIILYNRYQGKLRIFANLITDYNAYNKIRLKLEHPDKQKASGIFRHLLNYDQSLDVISQNSSVSSINFQNLNNPRQWWSTDVQLGYDPCVCGHRSDIDFSFFAVKSANVQLFGRSVATQQTINAYDKSYLSNESILNAANSGNGGSLIFKGFDSLLVEYDKELESYNSRMKSYNAPFNQGLRLIVDAAKNGIVNAGGTFVNNTIGDLALRTLVMIDGPSDANTATSKKWAEQASKGAKGALGKEFDNLTVSQFGKEFLEAPVRPSLPYATFSEMRISGSISDTGVVSASSFITPGSYKFPQQLTAYNYPAYNEAVGLFALLRKPQVYKLYDTSTFRNPIFLDIDTVATTVLQDDSLGKITSFRQRGLQTWVQGHQVSLRLKDPLKYKLNRALDFDDANTKLYVSFVVEMDNAIFDSTACFNFSPVSTGNMYLRDAFPPLDGKPYQAIFESTWENMKDVGEKLFTIDFTNTFNTFLDRDLLVVEQPNLSPTASVTDWEDCINEIEALFNVKRVKMKIAADMYFDQIGSNGLQNNTFQSFTYLLYDRDAGVDILNSTQDSTLLLNYKQPHLVLTNETIETTDPFVLETKGNIIYVNAKTIELHGNIDVQSGYKAELRATKNIKLVSGNTNVSNKVKFKIVNGLSRFDNITETTQSELDAFCQDQNNGYKALVAASKAEDEAEEPKEEPIKKIETRVYPNPAANQINITIDANDEREYTFQVFDLIGRSLINETITGANQPLFEINTELLSNGTYLLRINSADGVVAETHRIVILK